jgi:hypothetical protein
MKRKPFKLVSHRYVSRAHLCEIADHADVWDFNRQLDSKAVRTLPKNSGIMYPVSMTLPHKHRHGKPCEPHMRLMIDIKETVAFADVPLNYFNELPKYYTVETNGKCLLLVILDKHGMPVRYRFDEASPDFKRAANYFVEHCSEPKAKAFVQFHLQEAA